MIVFAFCSAPKENVIDRSSNSQRRSKTKCAGYGMGGCSPQKCSGDPGSDRGRGVTALRFGRGGLKAGE